MIEQNNKTALLAKQMFMTQAIIMGLFGAQLLESEAYYVVYLLLIVVGFLCLCYNTKAAVHYGTLSKRSSFFVNLFTVMFSLMISLSNYSIWTLNEITKGFGAHFQYIYCLFLALVFFIGSYFTCWHIFYALSRNLRNIVWNTSKKQTLYPRLIFIITFSTIVTTRWVILHFCLYPGNLTPDSISQIGQLISGSYSNHHPFYHTQVIRFCLKVGMALFHDINSAVATFSFIQILFTAACFSFSVSTMAKMQVPKWLVICSSLFFICMPYHLIYAITMWKDVPFGCFVLLLTLSLYRSLAGLGKPIFNGILLAISCLGTCLFRSNGFFVMILLFAAFALLWKRRKKSILIILLSAISVSYVLKYPVLEQLSISQPDPIESLSIPAQQIARVVFEGHPLNDWEQDTLSKIVDVDQISDAYQAIVSDPIKDLVRQRGNQHLLHENKQDYIKLYLSLWLKYPGVYARAWIDQTVGYWNAGYPFWQWNVDVSWNEFGITRITRSSFLNNLLLVYLYLYSQVQALRLFISIGLFFWLDLVMLFIALLRKDRIGIIIALPVLLIVLSLVIATPVFSEFRYIYAVFCVLPTVAATVLRPIPERFT